jgi:hypothetical protein
MKKISIYFSFLVLFVLLTNFTTAQTLPAPVENNDEHQLTDLKTSQRLHKDWKSRNSSIKNKAVLWYNSKDGYYGSFSNQDQYFRARYDHNGNYIETLKKKEWNEMVPSALKSSFENSEYKSYLINGYWEVADPNTKGYYLELMDDEGQAVQLWPDENGNISTTPRLKKLKN